MRAAFKYTRSIFRPALCLILFTLLLRCAHAASPHITLSADGTPISYEVYGSGEPTLVFVHGWSCDSRYWREQIPMLEKNYRVVVIDLAGHGHSSSTRTDYTMKAFGEDVKAVVDAVGATQVILIGHSMGGCVIGEATRLMPDKVLGLIGVDTLQNVEYPLTSEAYEQMVAPLKANFQSGCKQFVGSMLMPDEQQPQRRQWIMDDMASAPSNVAMSAMSNMMNLYLTGDFAKIFDTIEVPVICVNADKWPEDPEANRRHMVSYELITIPDTDHFLMLNRSDAFNTELANAIEKIQTNDTGNTNE